MPGIIVGVDGSDHSRHALEWAIREAAVRHAPLTVLTAPSWSSPTRTSDTRPNGRQQP